MIRKGGTRAFSCSPRECLWCMHDFDGLVVTNSLAGMNVGYVTVQHATHMKYMYSVSTLFYNSPCEQRVFGNLKKKDFEKQK
mmetsp:Transcript_34203/g.45762  ORF Transcript_34203/g.45762 Transcript_34203/m.45762 type:complete len:82 (+) Transcript_34203:1798-2043(+)